ncbi:MAG: NFYB/HAP3 family transcription factor subunit [Nanoarchaeota archaeon]|nr:NFYB/HAP3 family transcription factor subunit [Nanoarchaeota archaeon]
MRGIPLAAMEKIIRKSGNVRVSDSAKEELRNILVEKAEEITKKARMLSNHAGRKTIKEEDVKLAAKTNSF